MRLDVGSRLGPYQVLAPLGAGGMGEVYRARDTRLNREVAIKVLPAAVAGDPELYYRSESRFMTVPVESGAGFKAGVPRLLFVGVYRMRSDTGISYDVDPKGRGFLMIRPVEEGETNTGVGIVLNWLEEMGDLTAGKR